MGDEKRDRDFEREIQSGDQKKVTPGKPSDQSSKSSEPRQGKGNRSAEDYPDERIGSHRPSDSPSTAEKKPSRGYSSDDESGEDEDAG